MQIELTFGANQLIAGVDEVGRGPLAGPVVAAAVILDERAHIENLADSKSLGARAREALDREIRANARAYALAAARWATTTGMIAKMSAARFSLADRKEPVCS